MSCLAGLAALLANIPSNQNPQRTWAEENGHPSFGCIVGEAGDVDGDRIPDLVLGDSGFDSEKTLSRFWLVSGATGTVVRDIVLSCPGVLRREHYGAAFRVHGGVDVDADGIPDLLIAMQAFEKGSEGCVFLVSGRDSSTLRILPARGSRSPNGDWARFVDDLDGDGRRDVGILRLEPEQESAELCTFSSASGKALWSCPVANDCGSDVGGWIPVGIPEAGTPRDFVVVLQGKLGCGPVVRRYSSSARRCVWDYPVEAQRCRWPYAALGLWCDVDGDGERDVAIGLCDDVHVLSGRTGELLLQFTPNESTYSSNGCGWSLSVIQDSRASYGGLALAIAETEGEMWYGSVRLKGGDSMEDQWLSKPGFSAHSLEEIGEVHHFGYQTASIGDVNGDGVEDLVVGSWEGFSSDPGLAQLLSGKDGSVLFEYRRKGDGIEAIRPQSIKPAASPAAHRGR